MSVEHELLFAGDRVAVAGCFGGAVDVGRIVHAALIDSERDEFLASDDGWDDFLLLRAEVGEADGELAKWWTDFQTLNAGERDKMVEPAAKKKRRRRRRRKPRENVDG